LANKPLYKGTLKTNPAMITRQIILSGQVQGVGFRPFIYRLAIDHHLVGWVRNTVGQVEVHVQGKPHDIEHFLDEVFIKNPPLAEPKLEINRQIENADYNTFSILQSNEQGSAQISVPDDLFLCEECLAELYDQSNRRYHYPFINCTQCGPRYTLIRSLPYDRANTTMAGFNMCPQCLAEYQDPQSRRFHAEPIACQKCGPSVRFKIDDVVYDNNEAAIQKTVETLQQGKVVAVKGVGGYHLMCDAKNTNAITRIRNNKHRPHKPLAIMFPSQLDNPFKYAERFVDLSNNDKSFLLQPARSILLVEKKAHTELSEQIAPGLDEVGVMLPYSPLHHLLLNEFKGPIVATSANISGEPVLIDNLEVEKRLGHVADAYLHHNRPIERPADDPVYKNIANKPRPIRTGRGVTPLELTLPFTLEQPVLAVGAHMKNVIALAWGNRVVISPHIGDMDTVRSLDVFENTITDLQKLYAVKADNIICDAHPGYATTRWAKRQNIPVHDVYHHHAHASAAFYECDTDEKVMVFTWDGVGYGEDGTLWGGETFLGQPGDWQHVASMKPFYLPGGDKAGRQPWRSAAALCWENGLNYTINQNNDPLLHQAWQRKFNTRQTTSVGRLFDAAAALTGVCHTVSYEGQGPMEFEALCNDANEYIEFTLNKNNGIWESNWEPLVEKMLDKSLSISARATLFHASMANVILQQAKTIRRYYDVNIISFSGGVFQNRVLTEYANKLLCEEGFQIHIPERIPLNDAGISFGQIIEYGFHSTLKK